MLRTTDLAALRKTGTPTESNLRTVRRTLRLLHQEGYVHRIPFLPLDQTMAGASYANGLTDKGVKDYGGKSFDDHSARTLDHELALTDFHIALRQHCAEHRRELHWRQHNVKHGVNPDAYFSITDPAKEGRNTNHFFLEIERSKIGNYRDGEPSIIRKLRHYHGYYNTDDCEKHWRFRLFRVVLVLPNTARRDHLLAVLDLKHRMFWLGTQGMITGFHTPKGDTFSFADL